jgi:sugar (pentulose or hexulose) kinase
LLGATLIVWLVTPEWVDRPGLWTVPHTALGLNLVGGASNAGGLFLDWASDLLGAGRHPADPPGLPADEGEQIAPSGGGGDVDGSGLPAGEQVGRSGPVGGGGRSDPAGLLSGEGGGVGRSVSAAGGSLRVGSSGVPGRGRGEGAGGRGGVEAGDVPVWVPYLRGERVPVHRGGVRAGLHDLHIGHGVGAVERAAFEASGFVVRHILDLAGGEARRIVVAGGGVRRPGWVEALADCTGLPVDVAAVPDATALGSAFLARCVAGLESTPTDGWRWARTSRRVEPDPGWVGPCAERYRRFRVLGAAAMEATE